MLGGEGGELHAAWDTAHDLQEKMSSGTVTIPI